MDQVLAGGGIVGTLLAALGWQFRRNLDAETKRADKAEERADKLQAIIDEANAARAKQLERSEADVLALKIEVEKWKSRVPERELP